MVPPSPPDPQMMAVDVDLKSARMDFTVNEVFTKAHSCDDVEASVRLRLFSDYTGHASARPAAPSPPPFSRIAPWCCAVHRARLIHAV